MMLDDMREFVFEKRPVFASIVQEHGARSFVDYLQMMIPEHATPEPVRKQELLTHLERFLNTWVDPKTIPAITRSLSQTWTVGTADHHGIPWHPFFANENLAHARVMRVRDVPYALVFASSGVSLGNSSLPRSIGYHTERGVLERKHFFPASDRMHTVYGAPAVSSHTFHVFAHEKQLHLLADLWLRDTYVQEARSFSRQITHMTRVLTDKLPSDSFARIAYLPLEEFITHVFLHEPESSPIWQLITIHAPFYVNATKNIHGAHTEDFSHGSILFWKRTSNGLRQRIVHEPTNSPHELRILLERGELYPTYALCLMILSCYYGVTCMGGFSQVGYLREIHEAYRRLMGSCHLPPLQTNDASVFCGECVIARVGGAPATLLDVVLHEEYSELIALLDGQPLRESIEGIIPDLYHILQ